MRMAVWKTDGLFATHSIACSKSHRNRLFACTFCWIETAARTKPRQRELSDRKAWFVSTRRYWFARFGDVMGNAANVGHSISHVCDFRLQLVARARLVAFVKSLRVNCLPCRWAENYDSQAKWQCHSVWDYGGCTCSGAFIHRLCTPPYLFSLGMFLIIPFSKLQINRSANCNSNGKHFWLLY